MSGRPSHSPLLDANLIEISPHHIDVSGRIGFLHEDKAAALGRLMAVDGQRDPIKVVAQPDNAELPWRLVVGMHRTMGARIEGLTVFAIEVSGKPEDLRDLEASENLHRRPLQPIERAKFTAALVQAAQERIARQHGNLNQFQRGAQARWQRVKKGEQRAEAALTEESTDACATMAQAYGWEESVGEALGMSRRSIHRDLELFRLLVEPFPALAEQLSMHPVVGENAGQLREIAQVRDEAQRRRVIELLIADPELSAEEARTRIGIVKAPAAAAPAPYQKFYDQIQGGWSRLGLTEKRQFVPKLAELLDTDQLKRQMRDQLNKELADSGDTPGMRPALSRAFDLLIKLADGEPVDDEEIEKARHTAQFALLGIEEKA